LTKTCKKIVIMRSISNIVDNNNLEEFFSSIKSSILDFNIKSIFFLILTISVLNSILLSCFIIFSLLFALNSIFRFIIRLNFFSSSFLKFFFLTSFTKFFSFDFCFFFLIFFIFEILLSKAYWDVVDFWALTLLIKVIVV